MSIFDLLFAAAGNVAGNSSYLGNLSLAQKWESIAYGDGTFVAVSTESSTAAYSKDGGKTFTAVSMPVFAKWVDVVYCGNNTFIAFASSNTILPARSTDGGKTWSNLPTKPSGFYFGKGNIYANGVLTCIASSGGAVALSVDLGNTWTSSKPSVLNVSGNLYDFSVASGNRLLLASASVISGTARCVMSSDNGATWGQVNTLLLEGSAVFGDGVFATTTEAGNSISYSNNNGASWTKTTVPSSYTGKRTTVFGSGVFLGIGVASNVAVYSEDGCKSWKKQALPNAWTYTDVAYGDGVFVAVAHNQSQSTIIEIAPSV